jgi:hypothetical protein
MECGGLPPFSPKRNVRQQSDPDEACFARPNFGGSGIFARTNAIGIIKKGGIAGGAWGKFSARNLRLSN